MQALTTSELSLMLALPPAWVSAHAAPSAPSALRWRRLGSEERDSAVLLACRQVETAVLARADRDGAARWERGWSEILERVRREGASEEALRPQYFRHDTIRLMGDYARVEEPDFEFRLYQLIADLVFRRFLSGLDGIAEFACGTGINLLHLSKLFPGVGLAGYDWTVASQEILGLIADKHDLDLASGRVDLWTGKGFDPAGLSRFRRLGIVTAHGLEQIGDQIAPFVNMVLALRPAVVVHIEPLVELYNSDRLFDALAALYHRKRGYLRGLLPAIRRMRDQGTAEILLEQRIGFGSAFHEGYSLLVWRPC